MGPVQILIIGFDQPHFDGSILAELQRLRESDIVRLVDVIVVRKDDEGHVERYGPADLPGSGVERPGSVIAALIGLAGEPEDPATPPACSARPRRRTRTSGTSTTPSPPAASCHRPDRASLGSRAARRARRSGRLPPRRRLGPSDRPGRGRRALEAAAAPGGHQEHHADQQRGRQQRHRPLAEVERGVDDDLEGRRDADGDEHVDRQQAVVAARMPSPR